MAEKKVRVQNSTTDGTTIRVWVIHLSPNHRASFDVAPGQQVTNNHMETGHRGVIVYDDFEEKVILTSEFILDASNIKAVVAGDAASGYTISYAVFV